MKLDLIKYVLLVSLWLIQNTYGQFNQKLEQKNIYQDVADYHEKGQWQGYIYYYRNEDDMIVEQPQIVTLNQAQLVINGVIHKTEDLRFTCDSLSRAPCSFDKYKEMFMRMQKKFIMGAEEFIHMGKIQRKYDQCIVISLFEEQTQLLMPHLICTYVHDQMPSLKTAIKIAFQQRLMIIPLSDKANIINFGEDFDILYSFSDHFVYKTKIFMNQKSIDDSDFKVLVHLNDIQNQLGQKCKVEYPVSRMYKSLQGIGIKNSCCIQFTTKSELWNLCSLSLGDCVIPIKGIGNFIQQQCNHLNNFNYDHTEEEEPDSLDNDQIKQKSTYQQPADNEIYDLSVTDGDTLFQEKVQFQAARVVLYASQQALFNYYSIELVNDKPCLILSNIKNSNTFIKINVPEKIKQKLHNSHAEDCCLSVKVFGKMYFFCLGNTGKCEAYNDQLMRMQYTLISKCQAERFKTSIMEGHPNIDYNQYIENDSPNGNWKGYAKLIKITGKIPITLSPLYLEINADKMKVAIYEDSSLEKLKHDYSLLALDWICEDNEYPCTVEDYLSDRASIHKETNLNKAVMLGLKAVQAQSAKDCLILEFRSVSSYLNSEKLGLLVCPYSKNQLANIQMAIRIAYNKAIDNQENGLLGPNGSFAPEGYEFQTVVVILSGKGAQVVRSKVQMHPIGLMQLPEKRYVFEYKSIEALQNVVCGMEYGQELKIPSELKAMNAKSECCFSFILQTRRRAYLCVFEAVRCHQKQLMVMKRMRGDCLRVASENGLIDIRAYTDAIEQIQFSGITEEQDLKLPVKQSNEDVTLQYEISSNSWRGKIIYRQIDMDGELQKQGEQVKITSPQFKTAFMQIKDDKIAVAENIDLFNSGELLFVVNSRNIFFQCAYESLCYINSYLKAKTIKGQINSQQQLLQNNLKEQIEDFLNNLPNNQQESNCFVMEDEQPIFRAIKGWFICAYDSKQGPILRQMITNSFINSMKYLDFNDNLAYISIAKTTPVDEFNIIVMEQGSDQASAVKIIATKTQIKWVINGNNVIKFQEVKECRITQELNSPVYSDQLMRLPPTVKNECCFEVERFKKIIICMNDNRVQCLRQKMMLVKHIVTQCEFMQTPSTDTKNINKNIALNGNNKNNAPVILDDFDYGMFPQGTQMDSDLNINDIRKECMSDPDNGNWNGFVFMRVITDRFRVSCPLDAPLFYFFMVVDYQTITFYKDKTKQEIAYQFNTYQMLFSCADKQEDKICSPSQYLKAHSPENSINTNFDIGFYEIIELEQAILRFLRVLPTGESEEGCIVLENVEPMIKKVGSYLICTVAPEQKEDLVKSIKRSYYQAVIGEKIMNIAPTPGFYNDKFSIRLWEEGKVVPVDIVFTRNGMAKYFGPIDHKTPESQIKLLFKYSDIAQDNQNNNCAFQYRGRIKLPPEMEARNPDQNCCFTFKNKRGFSVFICSDAVYLKCLRDSRMIIKKLLLGCILASEGTPKSKFESLNGELPKSEIDNYQKVLYDDSRNGVWSGLIYWKELMKSDPLIATPLYCVIKDGQIQIYMSELDTVQGQPLKVIYIQGVQFDCDNDVFTCGINSFADIYQTMIEPGDDLAREKYFKQVQQVSSLLPIQQDQVSCCTVFRIRISSVDPNNNQEIHIICTRLEEQGLSIKRAINRQFEQIIIKSDVMTGVPDPTFKQLFSLQIYKESNKKVMFIKTILGPEGLMESESGRKLLGYDEIQPDDFGNKCAIWFKGTAITLPKLLGQFAYSMKCCLKIIQINQEVFMCLDKKYHCLLETRQLIKGLKLGCMEKQENNQKLELGKKDQFQISEVKQSDMKTLILGVTVSKASSSSEDDKPNLSSVFLHTTEKDLTINDERGVISGYILEGILPNSQSEKVDPREVYVTMDSTGMNVFLGKDNDHMEYFEMADLIWPCDSEFPCSPNDFKDKMITQIKKIGADDMNAKLTLLRQFYNSTLRHFKTNVDINNRCVALEFSKVKYIGQPNSDDDDTQKRIFCVIQDPPPTGSSGHEEEYFQKFKRAFSIAFNMAYSVLPFSKVHKLDTTKLYKMLFKSADHLSLYYGPQSINAMIGVNGLENKHDKFFDYLDADNCEFCYGIPENVIPDNDKIDNRDCCIEYKKAGEIGFMCSQTQFRCFYQTRMMVKFLYNFCKKQKLATSNPPGYCIIEIEEPVFNTDAQSLPAFKQIKSGTFLKPNRKSLQDNQKQSQIILKQLENQNNSNFNSDADTYNHNNNSLFQAILQNPIVNLNTQQQNNKNEDKSVNIQQIQQQIDLQQRFKQNNNIKQDSNDNMQVILQSNKNTNKILGKQSLDNNNDEIQRIREQQANKLYKIAIERYQNFNQRLFNFSQVQKEYTEQVNNQEVTYNTDGSVGIKYKNGDYVVSDQEKQQIIAFTNQGKDLSIKDLYSNDTFKQNVDKKITINFNNLTFLFSNSIYQINGTIDSQNIKYYYDIKGNYLSII